MGPRSKLLLLKQVLALRKNFSLGIITCIHNITEIKPHPGLSLHTKNMYIITRVYIHHTHQKQDNFLDKFPDDLYLNTKLEVAARRTSKAGMGNLHRCFMLVPDLAYSLGSETTRRN